MYKSREIKYLRIWLEQVERKEEKTLQNQIYGGNVGIMKSRGRPRKLEVVEKDLREK